MTLIDFKTDGEFINLINNMGAKFISFNSSKWVPLNSNYLLKRLNSYEGIEVSLNDITNCEDGTFEYNRNKILVYIRDQIIYKEDSFRLPKFHICTCKAIQDMEKGGRISRFVASTRSDGKFKIKKIYKYKSRKPQEELVNLEVCKYCLSELNYKNYSSNKNFVYNNFKLDEFFTLYTSSKHKIIPDCSEVTAPDNNYTADWDFISFEFRKKKNWICEECGVDLKKNKHLLHVHHINGIRYINEYDNLTSLCIICHSKKIGHENLKLDNKQDFEKAINIRKFQGIF